MPGGHHYCFVDFSTAEEAEKAMSALNGRPVPEGQLRVSMARSKKLPAADAETNSWHPDHVPAGGEPAQQQQREARQPRQPRQSRDRDAAQAASPEEEEQARIEQRREQAERQRVIMASNNWRRGP